MLLLLLPLMTSGCTAMLFHYTDWDCLPASRPDLRLFDAARQHDVLVVYNEVSDRNAAVQTRAYLLHKNEERIALRFRPDFVDVNRTNRLPPIPVFQAQEISTNISPPYYAVVSPNHLSFTFYNNQAAADTHSLPWYPDPVGQADRVICLPVAVTVDAALAAAALYLVWLDLTHNPDTDWAR